jgi:hypothetical protein
MEDTMSSELREYAPLHKNAIDLTGNIYGYLTVLGPGDIVHPGLDSTGKALSRRKWRVFCGLCSTESQILGSLLRNNPQVESCGKCGRKRSGDISKVDASRDDGMLLSEIANQIGVGYNTIYQRYKHGDRGERLRRPVKEE